MNVCTHPYLHTHKETGRGVAASHTLPFLCRVLAVRAFLPRLLHTLFLLSALSSLPAHGLLSAALGFSKAVINI